MQLLLITNSHIIGTNTYVGVEDMKRLLLLLPLLLLVACQSSVDIEGEKVTYDELQEKLEELRDDIQEKGSRQEDLKERITKRTTELGELTEKHRKDEKKYDELEELATNQKDNEKELAKNKKKLDEVKDSIEKKEKQLESLKGDIAKAKDEPIKVSPGFYYFGTDIDEGRYKLTAQEGQRGNVFVRGENSRGYVGETFGKGEHAIEEFTFEASEGDELEATIPIYLYPVE